MLVFTVLHSILLLAVTSIDAQCTGNFQNFFDFGIDAADTYVPGLNLAAFLTPTSPIKVFGSDVVQFRVSVEKTGNIICINKYS